MAQHTKLTPWLIWHTLQNSYFSTKSDGIFWYIKVYHLIENPNKNNKKVTCIMYVSNELLKWATNFSYIALHFNEILTHHYVKCTFKTFGEICSFYFSVKLKLHSGQMYNSLHFFLIILNLKIIHIIVKMCLKTLHESQFIAITHKWTQYSFTKKAR